MRRYKQKEIKELIRTGAAVNISDFSFSETTDFLKTHNTEKIGVSLGIYGINGGVIKDIDSGKIYAIGKRNSTLLMIF